MPGKFYLAARYSLRREAFKVAKRIERHTGILSTAHWLTGKHEDPDAAALWAQEDMGDIIRAHFFVLLHGRNRRGGMLVETGMALAWGKPIVIVENWSADAPMPIFALLDGVLVVDNVNQAITKLKEIDAQRRRADAANAI